MIVPVIHYLKDTADALMCSICRKSFVAPQYTVGHHAEIQVHHKSCGCQHHCRSYVSADDLPYFAVHDFSEHLSDLLMFAGFRLFHEQFTDGICQHDADLQDQHFDCIFSGFDEFSPDRIVIIAGQGKQHPGSKKHDHQARCITKNIPSFTAGYCFPGASVIF